MSSQQTSISTGETPVPPGPLVPLSTYTGGTPVLYDIGEMPMLPRDTPQQVGILQ
jgi:hypothetical protein